MPGSRKALPPISRSSGRAERGYQPIGGIPIAGRIVEALADGSGGFLHGQTYQAHLVACADWR